MKGTDMATAADNDNFKKGPENITGAVDQYEFVVFGSHG